MKAVSRRELYVALSAFAGVGGTTTNLKGPHFESEKSRQTMLSESEVLFPDRLPGTTNANGPKSWNILHGVLATGEAIALHESLQPAGIAPNPPHSIQHSELILIQQGTLLFESHGGSERVAEGGVILVAFGTIHAARNVGDGPAKYLVVAIGGDTG
jgi:mannose-6-phosphate isomerase-like protein (cupin superfamily)